MNVMYCKVLCCASRFSLESHATLVSKYIKYMQTPLRLMSVVFFSGILLACSNRYELDQNIKQVELPDNWGEQYQATPVVNNWLSYIDNPQVHSLVNKALERNFELKQAAYEVAIAEQSLINTGSALWPSLELSLDANRRKTTDPETYTNSTSLSADLRYELDVWGKLSDSKQRDNLLFLSEKANYQQARQNLVSEVVLAWFNVIAANNLLALYEQRARNSQQNLEIIESGYLSGLNEALDVYLARNELNNELTRVSEQRATQAVNIRMLERLVGDYPGAELIVDEKLPLLQSDFSLGVPSELITRKPGLQANWYRLLAQDSALAYAHKQRFPSLNITASIGDSADELSNLFSGTGLAWSLAGGVVAPIFDAGRLKSNEEIAKLRLQQTEKAYLDGLFEAFEQVENAITQEQSLKQRYETMLTAQENAMTAETLSFEQYQSGLVNYTTVLDAQSRSFDAQSTVIQIKKLLIANRIKLYLALGGNFEDFPLEDTQSVVKN